MICSTCKLDLPIEQFSPGRGRGIVSRPRKCKSCLNIADREKHARWSAANPGEAKRRSREYEIRNNEKRRQRWHNDAEYRERNKKAVRKYFAKNRDKRALALREEHKKVRKSILLLYGNICECCGEKEYQFLAIDHVKGGGSAERQIKNPKKLWRELILEGVRNPDYRILCHNCNFGSFLNGGICPHKNES